MKNLIVTSTFFLTFLLLLNSCETVEGCLNPNSTNYSPGADNDCCCESPELNVRIFPMSDTSSFDFDLPRLDAGGNEYFIQDFKFFISKISLGENSGNLLSISDTTTFELKDNTKIDTADCYILLDESVYEYTAGTFNYLTSFETLELELGLNELAQQIVRDSLEDGHPLKSDEMYKVSVDSLFSLRTIISITGQQFPVEFSAYELQKAIIPYTVTPEIAFDTWLELNIDFGILFQNINFLLDNNNTVANKIVTNLPQAIKQR